MFGPVMGLAAVAGPLLGGGLVNLNLLGTGWRAIFLVNVPDRPGRDRGRPPATCRAARRPRPARGWTPPSVLLAMVGSVALVYPLIEGREQGWPAWSFALLAAGVVTLGAFARAAGPPLAAGPHAARRAVDPAPPSLRRRAGGRRRLHRRDGRDDDRAQRDVPDGPRASPRWPAAWRRSRSRSRRSAARSPRRRCWPGSAGRTMHIGIVTMAVGLIVVDLVMRSASGGLTAWELAAPLAITGFGMGMVFVPMFDVILAGVAPHELGSASGLLESVQQLAMSLGIAVVGTVLFDAAGQRPRAGRVRRRRRPRAARRGRVPGRGRARRCSGCPSTRARLTSRRRGSRRVMLSRSGGRTSPAASLRAARRGGRAHSIARAVSLDIRPCARRGSREDRPWASG